MHSPNASPSGLALYCDAADSSWCQCHIFSRYRHCPCKCVHTIIVVYYRFLATNCDKNSSVKIVATGEEFFFVMEEVRQEAEDDPVSQVRANN